MKRLLLLTILIGLLFTSPNSFAQSSKPKRATIKYENGVKYVGEIRKGSPKKYSEYALIQKIFIGRKKLKHGKGIMYFANGDQLDGDGITINVNAELTNLPTEIFLKEKLARVPSKMER